MLFNRLALLAAVPIFLILAMVAYLAFRFATTEAAEQTWVLHTYDVRESTEAVLLDVDAAEAAARGYIMSRDKSYLVTYRIAQSAVVPDLRRFRNLTVDNPSQQARVRRIETVVRDRFSNIEESIALVTPSNLNSPRVLALMEQGRAKMDELRSLIAAAKGEEHWLLRSRIAATQKFESNTLWASLAGGLIVFLLLMAVAALLVRNNVALSRSEKELAHQAAVLQATLDSIRDGIAVFSTGGKLAAFNKTFFNILQFPAATARVGTDIEEFRAIDDARGAPLFSKLQQSDDPEIVFRRVSLGEREIDLYRAAVPRDGFLIVAADVTARVRSEAALRQSQKMEAVGQLTGGVAHDFNNLLQIVGANLDLIAADVRGNPQSASRLQNAIIGVERAARLTTQLLAFARRQPLEPRSINPGRLVVEMTDLVRRTLGEQIEVEAVVAGGLWNTLVDVNQLQNAMLNLAVNARDAMPDGGKLTIEVANAFLDDDYAERHSEVMPGQYVMIAATDTGHGMPAEVMARAFDPFFTTKPEGRGTGLGLSQVYGFVKQSGGHVKIYSEMGQGTTVKLYLPRTGKPQDLAGFATHAPAKGGSETVLVVEDDEGVRAAVGDMLAELGYGVLKAENAQQALGILKQQGKVDLLFTDVVMPGPVTTRELARVAKELQPEIKILFTSGYTQNAVVHNGRLDSDVSLLSKPYRKDELARKLRSVLDEPSAKPPPPIVQTELQPTGKGQREDPIAALGKALVVEDVALIRMTTVDMLAEIGLETAEADDGRSALEILVRDPDIGVLIADLGLPGMSGKDLAEETKRLRPDIKIVVASGAARADWQDWAAKANIVFLAKPFDLEQLRRALSES